MNKISEIKKGSGDKKRVKMVNYGLIDKVKTHTNSQLCTIKLQVYLHQRLMVFVVVGSGVIYCVLKSKGKCSKKKEKREKKKKK